MSDLIHRPFEEEDLINLQEWLNEEAVFKNLYVMFHPMSRDQLLKWYKSEKEEKAHIYKYIDNSNIITGMGMIHYIHMKNKCAEISLMVNPQSFNMGYGKKIIQHLSGFSFQVLNLHKIFMHTAGFNKAMIALSKKLKFTLEGTYRKELYWNGSYYDIYRYGMLDEEYFTEPLEGKL